ncbi:MAG: Arsenical resistance operon repressor [Candidatus Saccharibacteria bacterium]|jgi:DNA-binding transcriptional ArsR family regulator|nr:Arsenical resistance operon repressor [Candidatus Saccharibacteria bacterium]
MNNKTVAILKSLADDTRISIVRRLAQDECEIASSEIVQACADFLKLSQPTMSHHFARLVQSGVLIERKVGTEKIYQLDKDLLSSIGVDVTKL